MDGILTTLGGGWLVVINLVAFVIYFADKQFAKSGHRRVPERTLMLLAAAGGSVGALASMQLFRHKTRHRKFTLGIPAIMVAQAVLIYLLIF